MVLLRNAFILILMLWNVNPGFAQGHVQFEDGSSFLNAEASSDYSLIICDVNGDYRDDIVRSNKDSIYFHLQRSNQQGFYLAEKILKDFDILTSNVADLNNDYRNEIVVAGNKTGVQVYEFDKNSLGFRKAQYLEADHYAQGACVADINNDGFIDYFGSNDISYNKVFLNEGNGRLLETEYEDLNVLQASDASGNYNSIWIDPDGDGDLDLYISKCHVNATSDRDPRRVNQYFENRDGEFIERAASIGLDHGDQSWCAAAGDLDNDGDQDIFLLNHKSEMLLLENQDGNFITHRDYLDGSALLGDEQQLIIEDFNNDGLLDIFIFGFNDNLLLNRGDLEFEDDENVFGNTNAYSAACGDLDQDGRMDIYAVYGIAGSGIPDRLWLNKTGDHNYIRFSLNGVQTNAQAIGARIVIHGDFGEQTRWIKSGESYGISNTMNAHFGLADHSSVDSVICYWPSGEVDVFGSLPVNTHYVITESECIQELAEMQADSYILNCAYPKIKLQSDNFDLALWNDRSVSKALNVDQTGHYYASNYGSCRNATGLVYIDTVKALGPGPELVNNLDALVCADSEYRLYTRADGNWEWSNGERGNSISVDSSGEYFAINTNTCDTIYSEAVNIEVLDWEFVDSIIIVKETGDYVFDSGEDNTIWYNSEYDSISYGSSYELLDLKSDTLLYFAYDGDPLIEAFDVGPELDVNELEYSDQNENLRTEFEVLRSIEIESIDCYTDTEAIRRIVIRNASGDRIYESDFLIRLGNNSLPVQIKLDPGTYTISTDEEVNESFLGYKASRLAFNSMQADFFAEDLIKLNLTSSENNCFHNWKLKPQLESCISDLNRLFIDLDTISSSDEVKLEGLMIFPNPVSDHIYLELPDGVKEIRIVDSCGRLILSRPTDVLSSQLDLRTFNSGIYFLQLRTANSIFTQRIIKL